MRTPRHNTDLPPEVQAHVQRQLVRKDWELLLSDLRALCADCPADKDSDVCSRCPLEGIALDAATLTLQAHIAKLRRKAAKKGATRNAKHDI